MNQNPITDTNVIDEYIAKCDTIRVWASNRKKPFDLTFVSDVRYRMETFKCVSEKQLQAIDNILMKFKIAL